MDCPIHKVPMKDYQNDKGSWSSHKLDDDTWCNGKVKKPNAQDEILKLVKWLVKNHPNYGKSNEKGERQIEY